MRRLRRHRLSGEAALRIQGWLASDGRESPGVRRLVENDRRSLLVLDPPPDAPTARPLLLKHFRTRTGRHPWREAFKAAIGRSPARRELAALRALLAAGVPVPEPAGWAALGDGDELLALEYVPGRGLLEALSGAAPAQRRRLLEAAGHAIAGLHRAGWRHGDLHPGNLHVGPNGPLLLDLQRARRARAPGDLLADLGALDFGLERHGLSRADRRRLARAALPDPRSEILDETLPRAADRFAARHGRGRTRRALLPGRRFARFEHASLSGLRASECPAPSLAGLLEAHARTCLEGGPALLDGDGDTRVTAQTLDGIDVIVKEVARASVRHAFADLIRGSVARRSWLGGHGLRARGLPAPRPLAFVEERRHGLPMRSLVVLERVGDFDLGRIDPALLASDAARRRLADALARLVGDLHARGCVHGDLKAGNLRVSVDGAKTALWLIDLEDVRFRRSAPGRSARVRALVQLNASIGEDRLAAADRLRALSRHAARVGDERPSSRLVERIVARSLARGHVWQGRDCGLSSQALERVSQRK